MRAAAGLRLQDGRLASRDRKPYYRVSSSICLSGWRNEWGKQTTWAEIRRRQERPFQWWKWKEAWRSIQIDGEMLY